jgi:urease accessory protein
MLEMPGTRACCGTVQITELMTFATGGATPVQPRARGSARLSVVGTERGAVLDGLRQSGALKVLFPRVRGGRCQAVLVNTAGGVTGGDEFATEARAGRGAHLSLTTQAAERAYRAQPSERAGLGARLTLDDGARLDWLPQETILFDGCSVARSLTVGMAGSARLLLVEPLVFGRAARGERLEGARFRDRIEVRRDGEPVFLDAMTFAGDVRSHLARRHVAAGAGAMASLLLVSPDADAHLSRLRRMLPESGGASLIRDGVLFARLLAPDGFVLRRWLVPILSFLSEDALPRNWMI